MTNPSGFTWQSWADTQDDAVRDDGWDFVDESQENEPMKQQEKDYDDWSRT